MALYNIVCSMRRIPPIDVIEFDMNKSLHLVNETDSIDFLSVIKLRWGHLYVLQTQYFAVFA